jgi:outer membrane protein OmpA-like peptidoglycan-associated protein
MSNVPLMSGNALRADRIRDELLDIEAILRGADPGPQTFELRTLVGGFAVDSDVLTAEHHTQLDALVALSTRLRNFRVVGLIGRASRTGGEANNVDLSMRRAVAVSSYLTLVQAIEPQVLPDPLGLGSRDPILDVGPVEEPLNRSTEIVFRYEEPFRFARLAPGRRWQVLAGDELGLWLAGRQKLTIIDDNTGEQRIGTFYYVDASWSPPIPSRLLKALFKKLKIDGAKTPEELIEEGLADLAKLPDDLLDPKYLADEAKAFAETQVLVAKIRAWLNPKLAKAVLELATGMTAMPANDKPRALVGEPGNDFDFFDNQLTVLVEPISLSGPVGEINASLLWFGPTGENFAVCVGTDLSAGFGSLFPELSSGVKIGRFSFD